MSVAVATDRWANLAAPSWPLAIGAGVALGFAYTLSPLTVLCLPALAAMVWWVGRDLPARDQRWFFTIVAVAVLARLAVIAGLFVFADPSRPYATFFGDEELFKNRAIWLRNVALGVPISKADVIYAYDEVGKSGYLYFLELLQTLVGDAPYGIHLFNTTCFLAAVLLLFRLAYSSLGRVPALTGLALLLFMPSTFMWSISALKEPSHTLGAAIQIVAVVGAVRARDWRRRLGAIACLLVGGAIAEGVRRGASVVSAIGIALGMFGALAVRRPRVAVRITGLVLLVAGISVSWAPAQGRLLEVGRQGALFHVGHVRTQGYSYQALDPYYYQDPGRVRRMPLSDVARFAAKAGISVLIEPRPWAIETRGLLGFVPEQILWYAMVVLAILGLGVGFRQDALVTSLLVGHAVGLMALLAMTGGNIGTLVRHRGLAYAFLAWLMAFGIDALARLGARRQSPQEG